MLPTSSDNFIEPLGISITPPRARERLNFCNVVSSIPAEKLACAPKHEMKMAEFVKEIYDDTIANKELTTTHEFENDEVELMLRRRKLGLIVLNSTSYDMTNLEVYFIGVDESNEEKNFKMIGESDLKQVPGINPYMFKTKKTVHEVMKKCEKCRLILWVCSKDEKKLLELLVCTLCHNVGFEKSETENGSPPKKKTKRVSSGKKMAVASSSSDGMSTVLTDLMESSPTGISIDSNNQPTPSQSTSSNDMQSHVPSQEIGLQLDMLLKCSTNDLAKMIIRMEMKLEEAHATIQNLNINFSNLFFQFERLNRENFELNRKIAPEDEDDHKQVFIDNVEDAKENTVNMRANSERVLESGDNDWINLFKELPSDE